MSMNWLEGTHQQMDTSGQPQAIIMPVFAGQKLVVVGGSSGMGRQTAADVVAAGGSAVIIGQDPGRVEDTVQTLAKDGPAYGITADVADRDQVERVRQQLASEHADVTLLLRHPSGTARAAERPDGRGDGLPDLTRARLIVALQVRREDGVSPDHTRAQVSHHQPPRSRRLWLPGGGNGWRPYLTDPFA
jgi:short chain dehydrogenase